MPTYAFRCPTCETVFEEKRSFSLSGEPAICPRCSGDQATKILSTALFFTPGSAAKALLEPKPVQKRVVRRHSPGCPCCKG